MPKAHAQILCLEHHRLRTEVVDMYATEDVCSVLMPLTSGGANVTRGGSKLYYGDLHPGMLRLTVPEERSRVVFVSPVSLIELVVPGNILRRSFYEAGYVWPSGDTKFV